jgi:methionine-rich copper-binding protein CopC
MLARSLQFGAAAILLSLLLPGGALAHAFLDHADPKVGSTMQTAPTEIKVWFTEEIEPTFSTLHVFDSQGKVVDKKDAHVDPKDKKLLIVSVAPLGGGEYKVVWSVVAADTHHTHGQFKFTVKAKD